MLRMIGLMMFIATIGICRTIYLIYGMKTAVKIFALWAVSLGLAGWILDSLRIEIESNTGMLVMLSLMGAWLAGFVIYLKRKPK